MLKNYIKIAWRSLLNSKGFSFINITGLAIGMTAAMLIGLWIKHELGFDRFHERIDNLYIAYNKSVFDGELSCWSTTPAALGPALKQEFPEVKYSVRVDYTDTHLISYSEKKLEANGFDADADFLKMFSFPLLAGDVVSALNSPYKIIITEGFAKKMFGSSAKAMGKIIKYDNKYDLTVSGVLKNFPSNTRFNCDYITPWSLFRVQFSADEQNWGNNSYRTFIELKPNADLNKVNKKIKNITIRHTNGGEDNQVFLHPFGDYYLHNTFKNGIPTGGRADVVKLFAIVAGFILLIACINFMNLSTARSEKRAKEVGIRKAMGALKQSLVGQFLLESIIISFIAGVFALVLTGFALPYFNMLVSLELNISYADPAFWMVLSGFILFTGILAGCYPAFYLSSFKPVQVLKGTFVAVSAVVTPRKLLVITQFTFAVVMIISTIVIRRQIQYAQDRDSGYEKNNLLYSYFTGDIEKNQELIKRELLASGAARVVSVTSGSFVSSSANSWGLNWAGKPAGAKIVFDQMATKGNFAKVLDVKLVQGRDINPELFPTDSTACLLNESAAKIINAKNPIGQIIDKDFIKWHVVGVIKDFIWGSPYEPIEPMVIMGPAQKWSNVINIRLNKNQPLNTSLKIIESVFKKYNPSFPFNPLFVDKDYQYKFREQVRTANLAGAFAILTIIISCLGLFGLAAYMAASRTKEIGVRKVLGASVLSITTLLSKDFLKLVLASIIIATPIAWYAMNHWLRDYAYRIEVEWWIFALAGLGAIIIALLTVSFQSIKAAIANPVKSLRSE
ncbi:ABC transporter permease [Mucilaginibacter terrae]|uniref:ABC transport system permease protein n=1 Tax=Mucilaginibacter terrae TaxID=1955052 RepID=A0ABU3GPE6_9SPHI|nr:ABC transporter permease [Mucilaginibacter terrae]MDT3401658.1 putative ABC transport system permease protein [Mucilaginibacter terrae]